LIIFYWN